MYGAEQDPISEPFSSQRPVRIAQYLFRAVAVVEVPVDHHNLLDRRTVPREGVSCAYRNMIDEAEALADQPGLVFVGSLLVFSCGPALAGMMTRRSYNTKRVAVLASYYSVNGLADRVRRAEGRVETSRAGERVPG